MTESNVETEIAEINFENEISDGKNKNCVRCQFCNSLILSKKQGTYLQPNEVFNLPLIHAKNTVDPSEVETEPIKDFWTVGDVFQFENISVSKPVNNLKYLTCADCEKGPVGYQDLGTHKMCYVALSRVKYDK
ncbi:guanine nucleotide exchange factor MSS4 homolog [Eupeodes corollae]|uniref:guanine nucleotide exchange factor MSS4 homolog n=1 Tax=Eupeodes corollae TaxID=290404 RepID=UPI00249356AE|nr:guanine nucleotide exchange factor MSS4 homolog [Eupeodes corollae]